jgi:hypothetical protein
MISMNKILCGAMSKYIQGEHLKLCKVKIGSPWYQCYNVVILLCNILGEALRSNVTTPKVFNPNPSLHMILPNVNKFKSARNVK